MQRGCSGGAAEVQRRCSGGAHLQLWPEGAVNPNDKRAAPEHGAVVPRVDHIDLDAVRQGRKEDSQQQLVVEPGLVAGPRDGRTHLGRAEAHAHLQRRLVGEAVRRKLDAVHLDDQLVRLGINVGHADDQVIVCAVLVEIGRRMDLGLVSLLKHGDRDAEVALDRAAAALAHQRDPSPVDLVRAVLVDRHEVKLRAADHRVREEAVVVLDVELELGRLELLARELLLKDLCLVPEHRVRRVLLARVLRLVDCVSPVPRPEPDLGDGVDGRVIVGALELPRLDHVDAHLVRVLHRAAGSAGSAGRGERALA